MSDAKSKKLILLEARKQEALDAFLKRIGRGRDRKALPRSAHDAYLMGLKEGYGDGLVAGVEMGLDVCKDSGETFVAPDVGVA